MKVEVFSNYFNSRFLIHSQQVNDCCCSRSRLLATKRLISLEDSLDLLMLGVHIGHHRKARWKSRRWPQAGSIQLQEIHCQLSHCVQVNGRSSAQCREGTEKQASSLSHRKIHRVHQELTPHCKPWLQNLLLTTPTMSHSCSSGSRKMLENDLRWLGIPNQHHILFTGLFNRLQVTCVAPSPLGSPNSTAAFHGFPLISCFQWLEIEVLIFCPYSVPAWKGI